MTKSCPLSFWNASVAAKHVSRNGGWTANLASLCRSRVLGADADAALDLVAATARGGLAGIYDANADEGRSIARTFGLGGGHVAVLSLPLRGDTAYLICTTQRNEGFAAVDIDFADRFTLLLRQALFLREEQSQMAQTAKMAALGQMSASIAHELRQPLNTISLAVQNLEYLPAGLWSPVCRLPRRSLAGSQVSVRAML